MMMMMWGFMSSDVGLTCLSLSDDDDGGGTNDDTDDEDDNDDDIYHDTRPRLYCLLVNDDDNANDETCLRH